MAKIFTIHNEASAPDWFVNQPAKFAGSTADADRIANLPATLTDAGFTAELDIIEKCAAAKAPYFYNAAWDKEIVDRISEFATAYNVQAISANPSDPLVQSAKTQTSEVVKIASVAARTQPVSIPDAFHLESKGNMDHMKKAVWQQPTTEAKTISPSIFQNSGAVIRMSGSEDTRVSSHLKAIPGQNSVTNPNALHDLAEQVDTGARLRQEAKDRAAQRQAASREWETSVVQTLKDNKLTGKAKIAHDAGKAGGKVLGNNMHLTQTPAKIEKTQGEQLGQIREDRRKEIQRPNDGAKPWNELQETTKARCGDLLLAGLEAGLNKIAAAKQTVKTALGAPSPAPVAAPATPQQTPHWAAPGQTPAQVMRCKGCGTMPQPGAVQGNVCPDCSGTLQPWDTKNQKWVNDVVGGNLPKPVVAPVVAPAVAPAGPVASTKTEVKKA